MSHSNIIVRQCLPAASADRVDMKANYYYYTTTNRNKRNRQLPLFFVFCFEHDFAGHSKTNQRASHNSSELHNQYQETRAASKKRMSATFWLLLRQAHVSEKALGRITLATETRQQQISRPRQRVLKKTIQEAPGWSEARRV